MKEIIEFLPELFAYFIPGAITLTIYNFIFLKKQDHSAFIFWAIIISYIVKIVSRRLCHNTIQWGHLCRYLYDAAIYFVWTTENRID